MVRHAITYPWGRGLYTLHYFAISPQTWSYLVIWHSFGTVPERKRELLLLTRRETETTRPASS